MSASADAVAADPALAGRTAEVVEARRAAIHLARVAGFGNVEIADALAISKRGVIKLAAAPVPVAAVAAARLRLGLELAAATRGLPVATDRAVVLGRSRRA